MNTDPCAGFRLHREIAAVLGNDGIGGCQTETIAAGLGGEIWVEDTGKNIGGYSVPVVENGDPDVRIAQVFGTNLDDPAFRHGLPRVEQDVMEHLPDLAGIDLGTAEVVRNADFNTGLRAGARQVDGIDHELGNVNQAADRRAPFANVNS